MPCNSDGSIRGAITVAQIVGEVLFLATPLFALLWFVVCLPLLVALILTTTARDEHREFTPSERSVEAATRYLI
jgi:hypothetical protein